MDHLRMAPRVYAESIPHKGRAVWQQRGAILLLIINPVLFFWRVLVNPRSHIPFDIEAFHLPLIAYVAQSVRNGIAPLWDPYFYGGVPIHADSQAQVFYPFTWLAILAGNHFQGRNLFYWVEMLVPLHMVLAGVFAFWLLRRMGLRPPVAFLGATVYQLGGYFASQAQHLGAVCCGAWLPLTLLAIFEMRLRVRARWVAVLGLAVAMSILAGFVATTIVVAVAVGLTILALLALREATWHIIPAAAAGFLLGGLISTVELIPLWHLAQVSIASLRGLWHLDGGGLPVQSLVSLVMPDYYHIFEPDVGYKLPYNYTFLYVYCGIAVPLLLALAALFGRARERVFLGVTTLCVLWMLGEHTPVYHSLFTRLPVFLRGIVYAEYALMVFCLFAGLTAALALQRIGRRAPEVALWAVAVWTSYDLVHTGANRPMNSAPGGYKEENPGNQIGSSTDLVSRLRERVNRTFPPSRIDYLDNSLEPAITGAETFGLPTMNGDNPFLSQRMQSLRRLFSSGPWWERKLPVDRPGSPLLSMLNIRWLVSGTPLPDDQARAAGLDQPETLIGGITVYRNPRAFPRFFLVTRVRRSLDQSRTFQLMAQPGFDPAAEAIVENISGDRNSLATAPVRVKAYTPNRIELAVTTAGPAYLATSEPMYLGWQARVNGKARPLLMTNGVFRGLELAGGASEIVMEYHPPHLGLYLVFSSAMALLAIVLAGSPWKQRLRATAAVPGRVWISAKWLVPRTWEAARAIPCSRATAAWLLLFVPTILLFYWKILLTRQFSLLTESEGVNQAYSWLRFWVSSVRHGVLPLWDPYTFAGHVFSGEMQTAAFYPLHLVLALFPFNRDGIISPSLYHAWWAGAHLLGACFMFLLARELGLSRFPAFIAGISFSLGGFVSRMGWPHMLESAIWLPLIFLFFVRALRAAHLRRLVFEASLGGLALGMSILAGGFHVVILQALVIVSAACFHAVACGSRAESRTQHWLQTATAAAVVLAVGCAAGAIQLLPSMEYSRQAIRYLGAAGGLPATEKIPYQYMTDALSPHGIVAMLFPTAYNGKAGTGEVINPYLGVFPLLAALIGIRRNWAEPWVRYLAGLAVAAFLYSLGPFSWLHGVLYAIVPKLWMAREASRMLYLADFALALLAALGVETLFCRQKEASWAGLNRVLLALVIACAVCLFVPAVFGRPELSPWISLSMLLILVSYGLFRAILNGSRGAFVKLLVVVLILFDLSAFDWTALNLIEVRKSGVDHLERNLSFQGAARFINSQANSPASRRLDPFRVDIQADPPPNVGDLFGIPMLRGGGVTLPAEYPAIMQNRDLLNARFIVRPASAQDPGAIYQDAAWKVYANPGAFPRAWLVHEILAARPGTPAPAFNPGQTAFVNSDIRETIDLAPNGRPERVAFSSYGANRFELEVLASSRAMLVLSETYYPGWRATVNGKAQRIYRVDGDLRGVVVPAGTSDVVFEYAPRSVYLGAMLSLLAFGGVAYFAVRRSLGRNRRSWKKDVSYQA